MVENIDLDFFISLVEARSVLWDKTIENYKDIFESFDDKDNKEKTKLGEY